MSKSPAVVDAELWHPGGPEIRTLPWLVPARAARRLWRVVAIPTGLVVAVTLLLIGLAVGLAIGRFDGRSMSTGVPVVPAALLLTIIGAAAAVVGVWRAVQRPTSALLTLNASVQQAVFTGDLQPAVINRSDEIGQLVTSFNDLVKTLSARREHQAMLIADARHELRTPLTSLRTNVELLATDLKSPFLPDHARSEIMRDITTQVVEFAGLINGLVWLEDNPTMTASEENLDLSIVIGDALRRARRRGQGLQFDVQTTPFPMVGDPVSLERAIVNLLDNAIKYSPPDGTISVHLSGSELVITDQGPGVAEEDVPHIFARHYRSAHNPPQIPGTGLGLSMVADAVRQHRGTITVGRGQQGGAEFRVRFPVTVE